MWGGAANSRVCPKKPKYVAGSRRFGKGGQAGRTPRERAASPKTVNQSVSAPCVRRICAICRRRSRFASREALSMWRDGWRFTFVSPSGKKNASKKREQNTGDKRVGARRGTVLQTILLAYPPNTKGTVLSMRMQAEFQCATCEPYSFQATPLSVRSWSGRNPPDPKRRRRGTISLRTLVKPPAGFSVPGSQYTFSKSPSSRARWMLKK